jgi:flagellin-like hook-associated protein FlgL
LIALALVVAQTWPPTAAAQATAATLAPTMLALQELRKTIDTTINTVDAESAARLNQLGLMIDRTIQQVQGAIDNLSNKVQINETKLFSDVFTAMSAVNEELTNKGYLAYIGVNSTLANLATTVGAVPGLKVKPFLFATQPLRLPVQAKDTQVAIYGHFPDVDDAHPAKVSYSTDGRPSQSTSLKRFVGGSLAFELPRDYLREGQFVNLAVEIPSVKFMFIRGSETFNTRVYIENPNAFTFAIERFQANPNLWRQIAAPRTHTERADSNRTSNNGTASAPQLFSVLINDNVTYDASTATFATMKSDVGVSGIPCWCNCSRPSAQVNSWDANSVSWSLHAPSCSPTVCTRGGGFLGAPQIQTCGGGGTHAEVYLTPAFNVKVRNQSEQTSMGGSSVKATRNSVWKDSNALPPSWQSVSVVGTFIDGNETHSCHFAVTKAIPTGACRLFSGSVQNDVLVLQTR